MPAAPPPAALPPGAPPPGAPPPGVRDAFGVLEVTPLPGGQGTCWVGGGLVLKPGADAVTGWLAELLSGLHPEDVRVAEPVASRDGRWVVDGWSATHWVEGSHPDPTRNATWVAVVEAGRALHRALQHVPRPAVLDGRTSAWAQADRAAWGETAVELPPPLAGVARRLHAALHPLPGTQLVHGDLTTNVLVAPDGIPVVLDVSPYWRPASYAEGVVVADALCWHDAPARLVDEVGVPLPAVARALLFRLITSALRARAAGAAVPSAESDRYAEVVSALGL